MLCPHLTKVLLMLPLPFFAHHHFLILQSVLCLLDLWLTSSLDRSDAVESIGKGLSSLSTRFQLLKKEDILIENTEHLFLVKLPIL